VGTVARWRLPAVSPRPQLVAYVRHQVRLVLDLWDVPDLALPIEILTSELATNAVVHARTPFTVTLLWDGSLVRLEVSDACATGPRPRLAPSPDRERGRGLLLVDAVADEWGVEVHPHGKTVWLTLSRHVETPWWQA
jgi:anti-sigma regulatory factor (Ser/Thr protein kinase)